MIKLGNYVASTVGGSIFLVLLLIVGLDIISAIIDELSEVRGEYSFVQIIYFVLLTIPGRIQEFIPLSVLIGCLAGMGVLASNSELIVMRATGLSLLKLVEFAARPAIVMIVLSFLISEYVSPVTDRWAKTHKDIKLWGATQSLVSSRGLWHREGDNYMHFSVVQPGGVLLGISLFEFGSDNQLIKARTARRASFTGDRWLLEDIKETLFSSRTTETHFAQTMVWNTSVTPASLTFLTNEPNEMPPTQLFKYSRYLSQQGLDDGPYLLAFWSKALQPLATFSLVLIALSFIFGPLRSTTMGFRIFIGVVVGIAFQFAQNILGPSSLIYGFNPLIAVMLPIAICSAVGLVLLYRAK